MKEFFRGKFKEIFDILKIFTFYRFWNLLVQHNMDWPFFQRTVTVAVVLLAEASWHLFHEHVEYLKISRLKK